MERLQKGQRRSKADFVMWHAVVPHGRRLENAGYHGARPSSAVAMQPCHEATSRGQGGFPLASLPCTHALIPYRGLPMVCIDLP